MPQSVIARQVVDLSSTLNALHEKFVAHRLEHGGGPFPDPLRQEVLAALAAGASPAVIRVACCVTKSQLRSWRGVTHSDGAGKSTARKAPPTAEIFSVIDGISRGTSTGASSNLSTPKELAMSTAVAPPLKVSLGPWCISITQVGD